MTLLEQVKSLANNYNASPRILLKLTEKEHIIGLTAIRKTAISLKHYLHDFERN